MKNDPSRLCDGGARDPLAHLLSAGIEERPSMSALQRTLVAVSTAGAVTATGAAAAATNGAAGSGSLGAATAGVAQTAPSATAAATAGSLASTAAAGGGVAASATATQAGAVVLGLVKWAGMGVIGIGITTRAPETFESLQAAWQGDSATDGAVSEAPDLERAASPMLRPPSAEAEPSLKPRGDLPVDTTNVPSDELPARVPSVDTPGLNPAQVPKLTARKPVNDQLVQEVLLLERSRAALRRGAPATALATLSDYESRFVGRQLIVEVLVLRMEAQEKLGNLLQAKQLAHRVLQINGGGPYAGRARTVLETPGSED